MAVEWVLASGNTGKVKEFQRLMEGFGVSVLAQSQFDIESAEESGSTFIENALIKARYASAQTGLPALADDSGLVVPFLGGAPGVISARYAGEDASDHDNNQKLLAELAGVSGVDRSAYFVCVLVFLRHAQDPLPIVAQGLWRGEVAETASGTNGFGYDPLFFVPELACSAAQLSTDKKAEWSHRGHAFRALSAQLDAMT